MHNKSWSQMIPVFKYLLGRKGTQGLMSVDHMVNQAWIGAKTTVNETWNIGQGNKKDGIG